MLTSGTGLVAWEEGIKERIIVLEDEKPETEHVPNSGDRRILENQFFGSDKVHRLRDTFLDHSFEV